MLLVGCTTAKHVSIVRFNEDPVAYFRIAEVSSQLLPHMDVGDKGNYNFVVVNDETPNAHAISGHTLFINKGLLYILDDRELTCVIAHEIAHISLGHNARRAWAHNSRDYVFIEIGRISPDASLLSTTIKPLAIKAYSKQQETEADNEAVKAIRTLGISPEVYVTVLRRLGEHSEKNNEGKGGGLLDDHPSVDSRIEKIQKAGFFKD